MSIPMKAALANPTIAAALRKDSQRSIDAIQKEAGPAPKGPITFTVFGNPVSQNAMYRRAKQGKMFMSNEGVAWKKGVAACAALAMNGRPIIEGPVTVRYRFYYGSLRSDVDASLKGTQDALQGVVIADDKQIQTIVVEKKLDREKPRAYVEVQVL